jgi:DNA-binding NarL/FixJ family response regulator
VAVDLPHLLLRHPHKFCHPLERCAIARDRRIDRAEFVEFDSRNHVLLEHEPAWDRFEEAVLAFMPVSRLPTGHSKFAALSSREQQVLAFIAVMHISEKTVRNHASNAFDKLGVGLEPRLCRWLAIRAL